MFCRNIIEFPFWQITSTRYVLHCSTSHAKIHEKYEALPLLKTGHIERLKFAGTETNQHSGKT
jgi:hypothetical protein